MVRELLGNIKGKKGDKGDKGDMGEVSDINENIIPMSLNDWINNEDYSTTTGQVVSYNGRSRLLTKIPVDKGETYTISDESNYLSQLNGVRWYIFDGGEFVESNAITRGQEKQIVMTGDEITFALYPMANMANPARFIEHSDNRLSFKLERGSSKTKHLNVLKHYDRKISYINNEVIKPKPVSYFDGYFTGTNDSPISAPGKMEIVSEESINIDHTDDEFYLDEGFYFYSANLRPTPFEIGYTLVFDVVVNGTITNKYTSIRTHLPQITLSGVLHIKNDNTPVSFQASTSADIDSFSVDTRMNSKLFIKKI